MSIDKMPVFSRFPGKRPQSGIVLWIETKIYRIVSRRINWLLDRVLSGGFEIIPDGNEPGDDGNWRIIVVGDNLEFQKRIDGAWETGSPIIIG